MPELRYFLDCEEVLLANGFHRFEEESDGEFGGNQKWVILRRIFEGPLKVKYILDIRYEDQGKAGNDETLRYESVSFSIDDPWHPPKFQTAFRTIPTYYLSLSTLDGVFCAIKVFGGEI